MTNSLRTGVISTLLGLAGSLTLSAQSSRETISRLLDSARICQYIDFDKTQRLTKEASALIHAGGIEKNAPLMMGALQINVTSCNYFSRIKLWRENLDEASKYIQRLKLALGPQYAAFKLDNDLSWAEFSFDINDYSRSLEIFLRSFDELKGLEKSTQNCQYLFSTSQYIAAIHYARGEFEAAINQYLASIPYYECYRDTALPGNYTLIFKNIGQVYVEKKDYKRAKLYFDMAKSALRNYLSKSQKRSALASTEITLYEGIASYYRAIGKYDSSWMELQKAIPLLTNEDSFRGRIYLGLVEANERAGKFSAAKVYCEKAEHFFLKFYGEKNIPLSKTYLSAGHLYERQAFLDQALGYYQKSIESLVVDFRPDLQKNPALSNILSKKQLFTALQMKSRVLEKLNRQRNEASLLTESWQTNRLSLALLDSTANEYSLDKDKVILTEQSYSGFEDGIRLAYQLYRQTGDDGYFRDCYSLVDKSKGVVLLENLRVVNRFAGINPEWLGQEKEIKSELLQSEQELYKLELKKENSNELALLREHYAGTRREYASLISKIKTQAPAYYRLRFDRQVISPAVIQRQMLKEGEAVLEYFIGDSTLAVFGFSPERKYVDVKKLMIDFPARVARLRNLLTTVGESKQNTELLTLQRDFYNYLVNDCLQALGPGITSLTIIPDGLLGYFPFEVLTRPNKTDMVYLGDACTIHYAHSASYLHEQLRKKTTEPKYFFAGFVSSSANRTGNQAMPALPGAQKEVASVTGLLGTDFSVFDPASKNDFKAHAGDYKIIHLAMHSSVNDENPMFSAMVFAPAGRDSSDENRLTESELYSMQLNSELAVLSACNTGSGQLRRGEGIMSFSRAFAYAGVPSAVISLWKVPDLATSGIMVNFYKHLKDGLSKDKALQSAKKDFVLEYPMLAHPFYWSGFILTGNSEPIKFPVATGWLRIAAILLITFVVVWFGNKKLRVIFLKKNG